MKSLMSVALITCLFTFAQGAHFSSSIQIEADTSKQRSLSDLLTLYYTLKDALVNTDASGASASAGVFLETVNNIDVNSLLEADKKIFTSLQPKLAFDSRHISEVKSIDHQREHFSTLSLNMYKLAKAARLSSDPIYEIYCPMKKTYWLNNDLTIKNPYYGKTMISCGKVTDTIK